MRKILALVFGLAALVSCASGQRGATGDWVQLGQRAVTDRIDHDEIPVTASEGAFSSIKLAVRRAAVDFHRVEVHYRNGTTQRVELRNTIGAGGESRSIDLVGDDRIIRSVEFWYDARTARRRSATVHLLGKR